MFEGKCKAAERILKGAFKRSREIEYDRGAALSAEFLGEICYCRGDYESALEHLAFAERHAEETAPHGDIAVEVLRRKAEVLIALERNAEAEETLVKALQVAEHLHDQHELGAILRAFGVFEAQRGDIPAARSYFKEAIATFRLIKDSFELAGTYLRVAKMNLLWSQGNGHAADLKAELLDEARSYATEGAHLFASIDLEERAGECRELSREIESHTNGNGEPAKREKPVFDKRLLRCGSIVAKSRHMRDVVDKTRQIGAGASPVFISGETGTGKELVARLVHKSSARAARPFVAVNCACVPETVFESEMFGHRRGAFTGAVSDKIGLMEQASGGTLFLDEVSTLSSGQQAKLLRALQEGSIRGIGELKERPVDVRIVSASNEDAEELLSSGRLRSDFFYRIAARTIDIEPLRKRRDDIVPLFSYFLNRAHPDLEVESGVLDLFESYHWPGNVRELMNVVSALVSIAAPKGVIRLRDLPIGIRDRSTPETDAAPIPRPCGTLRRNGIQVNSSPEELALTRENIMSSLDKCGNNRTAAARKLGIGRSTFYRRMKELDLAGD